MDDDSELDDVVAPTPQVAREPGWYRHDARPGGHRYWDGQGWTDNDY